MLEKYLTNILDDTNQDTWTFYDLSECPKELFAWLVKLARLAREKEMVMSMESATFNMTPVHEAEVAIKKWKSLAFADVCSTPNPDEEEREVSGNEHNYQF
jgi:hypothetical protein